MPIEGQWARQQSTLRQLGRRERRLLAGVALVLLAGIVAVVIVAATAGGDRLAPGCIRATVAGATGSEQLTACGADAARLCRSQVDGNGPQADVLRVPCRRAGYR